MLHVRSDLFDEKTGTFQCLFVESPRKTGFSWVEPKTRGKRSWLVPVRETAEALECHACHRFATAQRLSGWKPNPGMKTVWGLVCMECGEKHDQERAARKGQVKQKGQVDEKARKPVLVAAPAPAVAVVPGTVKIPLKGLVAREDVLAAIEEWKSRGNAIKKLDPADARRAIET